MRRTKGRKLLQKTKLYQNDTIGSATFSLNEKRMDKSSVTATTTASANVATDPSPLEISGWVLFAVAVVIFVVGVSLLFTNGGGDSAGKVSSGSSSSREAFSALQRALESNAA